MKFSMCSIDLEGGRGRFRGSLGENLGPTEVQGQFWKIILEYPSSNSSPLLLLSFRDVMSELCESDDDADDADDDDADADDADDDDADDADDDDDDDEDGVHFVGRCSTMTTHISSLVCLVFSTNVNSIPTCLKLKRL